MSDPERVLVEILVAAPIETVWRAIRERAEWRRWFGWDYAGADDELDFIFKAAEFSDSTHTMQVVGMPDRFALEPVGSSTIVRVIRSAPVDDVSWQDIYHDVIEGWRTFVHHLRLTVERHRGADRRTLYLSGRAQAAGTKLPIDALGLRAVDVVQAGQPYGATTALGEALTGIVWFRTPYTIGLTVDGYGGGLLVVTNRPTTEKSPNGGGSVLISTYGSNGGAQAALRARWSEWWRSQYDVIEIQPADA